MGTMIGSNFERCCEVKITLLDKFHFQEDTVDILSPIFPAECN